MALRERTRPETGVVSVDSVVVVVFKVDLLPEDFSDGISAEVLRQPRAEKAHGAWVHRHVGAGRGSFVRSMELGGIEDPRFRLRFLEFVDGAPLAVAGTFDVCSQQRESGGG